MTSQTGPCAPRLGEADRRPGARGTLARVVLGGGLVLDVFLGQLTGTGLSGTAWLLGLVILPGVATVALWVRALHHQEPLRLLGIAGYAINIALATALLLPQFVDPEASFMWDGGLLFVGASMLLAAATGYRGCEITAVPNVLLHRDDQLGCVLLSPVDRCDGKPETPRG